MGVTTPQLLNSSGWSTSLLDYVICNQTVPLRLPQSHHMTDSLHNSWSIRSTLPCAFNQFIFLISWHSSRMLLLAAGITTVERDIGIFEASEFLSWTLRNIVVIIRISSTCFRWPLRQNPHFYFTRNERCCSVIYTPPGEWGVTSYHLNVVAKRQASVSMLMWYDVLKRCDSHAFASPSLKGKWVFMYSRCKSF